MRVVDRRVERVRDREVEALLAELPEGRAQVGRGRPRAHGEGVGGELVPAGERGLERLQQEAREAEPEAEDGQRPVGRLLEREGLVERAEGEREAQQPEARRRSSRSRARAPSARGGA